MSVVLLGIALLALSEGSSSALPWTAAALKTSGYLNLTGGALAEATGAPNHGRLGLVPEAEVELTPQAKLDHGTVLAARVALNAQGRLLEDEDSWVASIPEASAFAIGRFGRIEVGSRAGFPQTLVGFAPAEIAFASALYGPEAGRRLDPAAGLPTAFLTAELATRIDSIAYLGYAIRAFGDRSPKVIYVSPRRHGFYFAASYAPRRIHADGPTRAEARSVPAVSRDRFGPIAAAAGADHLVQVAMVFQRRTDLADFAAGLTYSRARRRGSAADGGDDHSLSGGASATIADTWVLAASATYDGLSSSRRNVAPASRVDPFGVIGSVEWVSGPWVAGGYYQRAIGYGAAEGRASDRLHFVQGGVSYLFDEHAHWGEGVYSNWKVFAGVAYYDLVGETGGERVDGSHGNVWMLGTAFSFY